MNSEIEEVEAFLEDAPARSALGGAYHARLAEQWTLRARLAHAGIGSKRTVEECLGHALRAACAAFELGHRSDPHEMAEFALWALAARDRGSLEFLSSVPADRWSGESGPTARTQALLLLARGLDAAAAEWLRAAGDPLLTALHERSADGFCRTMADRLALPVPTATVGLADVEAAGYLRLAEQRGMTPSIAHARIPGT